MVKWMKSRGTEAVLDNLFIMFPYWKFKFRWKNEYLGETLILLKARDELRKLTEEAVNYEMKLQ
jgi:hypothetical protein